MIKQKQFNTIYGKRKNNLGWDTHVPPILNKQETDSLLEATKCELAPVRQLKRRESSEEKTAAVV